jgi:hypothetical protein
MTLDQLANALRGMPRGAPMLVATADGLRLIVMVKPGWLRGDGTPGHEGGQAIRSPWSSVSRSAAKRDPMLGRRRLVQCPPLPQSVRRQPRPGTGQAR